MLLIFYCWTHTVSERDTLFWRPGLLKHMMMSTENLLGWDFMVSSKSFLQKLSLADFAQRWYKDVIVGGCDRKANDTIRSSALLPIIWTMTSPSPAPPVCGLGTYENERTSQFSVFTTFQTNHQICLISLFWLVCFSSNIQPQRLVPDVSLFFHFLPCAPSQGSQKVWTMWLNSVVLCGLGQPPSDSSNCVSQTEKANWKVHAVATLKWDAWRFSHSIFQKMSLAHLKGITSQ